MTRVNTLQILRPDIEVVGDELMPFGKVQDFSPYIEKIKASGAQSVVTGNYNRDLNLLIKAAVDAGLDVRFDTYLAHSSAARPRSGLPATAACRRSRNSIRTCRSELNKPDAEKFSRRLARQPRHRLLR